MNRSRSPVKNPAGGRTGEYLHIGECEFEFVQAGDLQYQKKYIPAALRLIPTSLFSSGTEI